MVIQRAGSGNADKEALAELESLASKGISEDEIEDVVSAYTRHDEQSISSALRKLDFKREKTMGEFESGKGSFRRG